MKKLSPLDASWLMVESRDTPMHVAGLQIFSLPKNAPDGWLQKTVSFLKSDTNLSSPWNMKLRKGFLSTVLPSWTMEKDIDLDYHIRHSALPFPGGERELGILVSRLHTNQLDFTRPLWECHVIEGLENNRFALYTKMHHSMVDGVGGMRMMQKAMGTSARDKLPPPWCAPSSKTPRAERTSLPDSPLQAALAGIKDQAKSAPDLIRAIGKLATSGSDSSGLTRPFSAPKTVLNKRINGQRRFATQQYSLARMKALAKNANCTLNDLVLWLSSTSLRKFMKDINALPSTSLTAGIPVNVRPADGTDGGNAISFIMATLGTNIADPKRRLDAIKDSTEKAKEHLQSLPKQALTQYTMVVMAPYMLELITGLGGRTKPVFNVTISNVPGPDKPLYFQGAKLEAMYPVSLLANGQALNITCCSYAGTLNFGFTGARDALPHMQRIATYCGEALEEFATLYA